MHFVTQHDEINRLGFSILKRYEFIGLSFFDNFRLLFFEFDKLSGNKTSKNVPCITVSGAVVLQESMLKLLPLPILILDVVPKLVALNVFHQALYSVHLAMSTSVYRSLRGVEGKHFTLYTFPDLISGLRERSFLFNIATNFGTTSNY